MPSFNEQKLKKIKFIDKAFSFFYYPKKKQNSNHKIDKDNTDSIFLIGLLLIGDTVMYLPAFKILRQNFPKAKITLLCGAQVKTILDGHELIDEFIIVNCPWIAPFDKSLKNILNFYSSLKQVRKFKYQVAIDFRGDWRNIFYMNFVKANRKISYDFTGGNYMLTDIIKHDKEIVHFTEEVCFFLKEIGCVFHEIDCVPSLQVTENVKSFCKQKIKDLNLSGKIVIGLHPGSSLEVKKWEEEKFAQVIINLSEQLANTVFLIFEGPGEEATIQKIEEVISKCKTVKYYIIRESLKSYVSIISLCNLVICNDSGAAHLASAYNIPTVIIFGNVDPKFVAPYKSHHAFVISHQVECKPCHTPFCRYGNPICIKGIGVEEVFSKASLGLQQFHNI